MVKLSIHNLLHPFLTQALVVVPLGLLRHHPLTPPIMQECSSTIIDLSIAVGLMVMLTVVIAIMVVPMPIFMLTVVTISIVVAITIMSITTIVLLVGIAAVVVDVVLSILQYSSMGERQTTMLLVLHL